MRREQYRVRVVFIGTGDFDKDVGSFKVYPYPRAGAVHDGGVEVIDELDVGIDGFDSRQQIRPYAVVCVRQVWMRAGRNLQPRVSSNG